jgi:pyruvate,orthophosphate dikinase
LTWADEIRHGPEVRKPVNSGPTTGLLLYANADSAEAVQRARALGAEGIGLYRTDQFLLGERTELIQRIVLSDDPEDREAALQELEEGLTGDFSGLFDSVSGFPCVVRLADASMQEYLPSLFDLIEEVTIMQFKKQKGAETEAEELQEREKTLERVQTYYEQNPGVGLRGVRISLCVAGLLKAQLRAAIEALHGAAERGGTPQIQLLVPFPICADEVAKVKAELKTAATAINKEHESPVSLELGSGIEVPRAAIIAEKLAEQSDLLVFGTNELTEFAFGYAREDAEKEFLPQYLELEVLPQSPFEVLDQEGVGELVRIGVEGARAQQPSIVIGVAGDNCGDPQTIRFLNALGVNFVSCSASALPLARLAAAQAILGAD